MNKNHIIYDFFLFVYNINGDYMINLYIIIELILLFIIIIGKFILKNSILNIIKFIPLIINILLSFIKKINIYLRIGLVFSIIADYSFLIIDNHVLGVLFYLTTQIFYFIYLNKINNKKILYLIIINMLLVFIFNNKILKIEGLLYGIISLYNIYKSYKLGKINKKYKLFNYSLILLLLCDLTILIRQLIDLKYILNITFDIMEWLFYIPSCILIIIYSIKYSKK